MDFCRNDLMNSNLYVINAKTIPNIKWSSNKIMEIINKSFRKIQNRKWNFFWNCRGSESRAQVTSYWIQKMAVCNSITEYLAIIFIWTIKNNSKALIILSIFNQYSSKTTQSTTTKGSIFNQWINIYLGMCRNIIT